VAEGIAAGGLGFLDAGLTGDLPSVLGYTSGMKWKPRQVLQRASAPLLQFADGFLCFLRGFVFLGRHPALWPYAVLPFLINAAIVVAAGIALAFALPLAARHVCRPELWWHWILFVLGMIAAIPLGLGLLYFLFFMLLPGIVSPPFKGKLTRYTRQILKKTELRPAGGIWVDAVLPTIIEIRKAVRFLLISLVLLPVNLVPVVGQVAYLVLMSYYTWMHMALNYLEYPIDSESWVLPLALKRKYVRSRRWPALGFGCALSLTCLVPFLNFFCMPVGVVGATLLYHAYGEQEGLHEGAPPSGVPLLG
jgi:CysZ protein